MALCPLLVSFVLVLWEATVTEGALSPRSYKLEGVMSVNGSDAYGGCPTTPISCVGSELAVDTCNCPDHAGLSANATTGVLFDGVVPTINTTESTWATLLYTLSGSTDTVKLTLQFEVSVILTEVEMYLFHCPAWGIGAENILVHNSDVFPTFTRTYPSRGSVTLGGDMEDCDSLIRVSVPLNMATSTTNYAIEFNNPSGDSIEWVYIAEMRLSDLPIPVPTTVPETATGEATTDVLTGEFTDNNNETASAMNTTGDSNDETITITEDPGDADDSNSTSLVPLPSTTSLPAGTSVPTFVPPSASVISPDVTITVSPSPISTPIFTTQDAAPVSDLQRSYLTFVAVAVVVTTSLFALLIASLLILVQMRHKYKKIEKQRRDSIKVPSVRRHTIM